MWLLRKEVKKYDRSDDEKTTRKWGEEVQRVWSKLKKYKLLIDDEVYKVEVERGNGDDDEEEAVVGSEKVVETEVAGSEEDDEGEAKREV
ncbi:hypothetical protein HMI56_004636, partial [Coelomomyces lativittatus]